MLKIALKTDMLSYHNGDTFGVSPSHIMLAWCAVNISSMLNHLPILEKGSLK
jgi:hypothetical protein